MELTQVRIVGTHRNIISNQVRRGTLPLAMRQVGEFSSTLVLRISTPFTLAFLRSRHSYPPFVNRFEGSTTRGMETRRRPLARLGLVLFTSITPDGLSQRPCGPRCLVIGTKLTLERSSQAPRTWRSTWSNSTRLTSLPSLPGRKWSHMRK